MALGARSTRKVERELRTSNGRSMFGATAGTKFCGRPRAPVMSRPPLVFILKDAAALEHLSGKIGQMKNFVQRARNTSAA
jgi:hypothetical protein